MMKSKVAAVPRSTLVRAVARTEEEPVTPLTYLAEIVASSWKHPGQLAVAALCAAGAGVGVLWIQSLQRVQAFRSPEKLVFILAPIGAFLLFEATVAAWRLYRRQQSALATTRSLLDLNASDRTDLERRLRTRYLRRERLSREMKEGSTS